MSPATPRPPSVLVLALTLSLVVAAVPRLAAQVAITADQAAYEVSQQLTVTIEAPPGAPTFLLVDVLPGPTIVPGIGTFHLGFSPFFFYVPLGPMNRSGSLTLQEQFSCRTAHVYGQEVYLQVVAVIDGVKTLSDGLHFAEVPGDCNDDCVGGVSELGLQVPLAGVPSTGTLHVHSYKTNGAQIGYGTLDVALDLDAGPTGVLPAPIFNADHSIAVTVLDRDGATLTVRFFVNAPAGGHAKLGGNTLFHVSYGGVTQEVVIHTSCSQPLYVGLQFGDFHVVKVLDLD
jgi:hypothetical protein